MTVGADAHIGPLGSYEFAADFCKNAASCRAEQSPAPTNCVPYITFSTVGSSMRRTCSRRAVSSPQAAR